MLCSDWNMQDLRTFCGVSCLILQWEQVPGQLIDADTEVCHVYDVQHLRVNLEP